MIQETRETQILDAAEALLTRYGLRRVTMDDVAEAVGLSRPAVYQYFSSKSALITAALNRFHTRVQEQVETELAYDGPLSEQLKRAIMARDGLYLEQRLSSGQIPWYLNTSNADIAKAFEAAQEDYQVMLRRHMFRGGVSAQSAKVAARMIISSSAGLMSMVSSQNEFSDDLDEFITLILNKVTPRGQSEATGAAGLGDDAASRIVM
ncbi:TetR/AcrR family transcriptional regulator [Ponticaulis sp.]|uniref:TetR/AcrR family transcriptional regulator n=1 Tax=Ponticaulis sp. TaxID=2020902 RepID=UPI000C39582D|nr:TetR/AcrR family transcriptional regulator [Ponticaulis sp.]MAF58544.1 hypothetical protein [Ponticaulis sp.]MBN03304.1 hypothetical protein [Ponticaulis sp.]